MRISEKKILICFAIGAYYVNDLLKMSLKLIILRIVKLVSKTKKKKKHSRPDKGNVYINLSRIY